MLQGGDKITIEGLVDHRMAEAAGSYDGDASIVRKAADLRAERAAKVETAAWRRCRWIVGIDHHRNDRKFRIRCQKFKHASERMAEPAAIASPF